MIRPACMTDDEWSLWQSAASEFSYAQERDRPRSPCLDCTPAFHDEMRAVSRCDGEPGMRTFPDNPRKRGWRESKRRQYAREAGFRGSLGVAFSRAAAVE